MRKLLLFCLGIFAFAQLLTGQAPEASALNCGFDIEVTAIGTHVKGRLKPRPGAVSLLTKAVWKDAKTGLILENGPEFDHYLNNFGHYSFRVDYETLLPTGDLGCVGTLEQDLLILESGCYQPLPGVGNTLCPSIFAPVCGCNGVTYQNECDAKAAGVSAWWAGECANQPPANTCGTTDFTIEVIDGSPSEGYWVRFDNLAAGNFTHIQLDFGDSCQIYQSPQWSSKMHHYQHGGIFRATLTAWNVNQSGCVSSVSKTFATDALSLTNATIPGNPDYVLPGDANGDGKANAYDLLYLSKGYGATGAPRPEASNDWAPQYAPNWTHLTNNGINYKHFDSNGDGTVNEFDTEPIEMHYQPLQVSGLAPAQPNTPPVYVSFDQDTIYINPANPQSLQISAHLMVGDPTHPVSGLYGLACAMRYPEFVAHDPTLYYDPSFFGPSNFVLSIGRDFHSAQQFDAAFSHKSGAGANGYGRMAQVSFRADYIIIIDIIDRAETDAVPFIMPVEGIKAIDSLGNLIPLSPAAVLDTLWIKAANTTVSATQQLLPESSITLAPNPATDYFELGVGNLAVERIEVFNALGQYVKDIMPSGTGATKVQTADWSNGMYHLRIRTDRGVVEKKLMITSKQ